MKRTLALVVDFDDVAQLEASLREITELIIQDVKACDNPSDANECGMLNGGSCYDFQVFENVDPSLATFADTIGNPEIGEVYLYEDSDDHIHIKNFRDQDTQDILREYVKSDREAASQGEGLSLRAWLMDHDIQIVEDTQSFVAY